MVKANKCYELLMKDNDGHVSSTFPKNKKNILKDVARLKKFGFRKSKTTYLKRNEYYIDECKCKR